MLIPEQDKGSVERSGQERGPGWGAVGRPAAPSSLPEYRKYGSAELYARTEGELTGEGAVTRNTRNTDAHKTHIKQNSIMYNTTCVTNTVTPDVCLSENSARATIENADTELVARSIKVPKWVIIELEAQNINISAKCRDFLIEYLSSKPGAQQSQETRDKLLFEALIKAFIPVYKRVIIERNTGPYASWQYGEYMNEIIEKCHVDRDAVVKAMNRELNIKG